MKKALIAFLVAASLAGMTPVHASGLEDGFITAGYNLTDEASSVWSARKGDYFIVDLINNIGYLVRQDNRSYYKFQVITGQKRTVFYLGRSYFAATPEKAWEAKEEVIQGDRVTFGKTGRFIRLYDEGARTNYGIHGHKYAKEMFEKNSRYQSMGCIIVKENFLDLIERTFELNGNTLKVITTKDIGQFDFLN